MREKIEIIFRPGKVLVDTEPYTVVSIPCPDELQEDVHLYMLGALKDVILNGIKGAEEFHRG